MEKQIYYMMNKNDKGFYISIVDTLGNNIMNNEEIEKDEVATYIQDIREDNFFVGWDINYDEVYLSDNYDLLDYLIDNERFIDQSLNPIKWVKRNNKLAINIVEDEKDSSLLKTNLILNDEFTNIEVINEDVVVVNNVFYILSIKITGLYELSDLVGDISVDELESFLTIAFKHFKNLEITYKDYLVEDGTKVSLSPKIIIEKISIDNSLYIQVNAVVSSMDYNFLNTNGIIKVVTVSDIRKTISISEIDISVMSLILEEVIKILTKIQRELGTRNGYYLDDDNFIILQEDVAREFIMKELLQLANKYGVVGTDKLKKYNIKAVKPKIAGKFSYAIDFLEGDVELDIEGEKFSIQDVLSTYKKESYIVLSDGTNAIINKKYIEKLERIFKKSDDQKIKVSFFDLPLVESLIDEKIFSSELKMRKDFFYGINDLKNYKMDIPKMDVVLREYQEYGYKWLAYLNEHNLGGCLADDMGLGKTLQAIAILTKVHEDKSKKSIIVMPKSLIFNWESEIRKFSPNLNVGIYYGNTRNINDIEDSDIILTTYGTIRNDIENLREMCFDLVILDESQNIKNINSQTTKAIMLLNSKNRIALSGTPIENNLTELYSLFRFLNPSMFGTLDEFNRTYGLPIQRDNDLEVINDLKKKIYPFVLRRIKKEVLKDLPDKIEKVMYTEMSPDHKKFYEERRTHYYNLINSNVKEKGLGKTQFFILQALNELRRITSCPESINKNISSSKKEVLLNKIIEAVKNGHKVLVFANYIGSIESICKALESNNIEFLKMTGETKDRQSLVDKFQTNPKYKVFVMTLKTGGVGLNLTAADTIFIYDPWWNKTVENQAIDRAYRLGQDRTVFSYKLILKDTIEEKILKLQEIKSKLLDNLISDDNLSFKSFTEKDIEFILGE